MKCKKCGQEVDKKAVICPGCGCKIKKPVFKKWWFWAVVVVIVIVAVSGGGETNKATTQKEAVTEQNKQEQKNYEAVDLQSMFDDLEANAMKAESKYENKYVEFGGKIKSFDSDGSYISVEPVNASVWNFTTAMCYIKNDTQKTFLIEKNVGDIITIRGKVTSIGEILGYSVNIDEVY